jgi:hypothetical protein
MEHDISPVKQSFKSKQLKSPKIIGVISGHGSRSDENDIVILPKELDWFVPLCAEEKNVGYSQECSLDDLCVLETIEDRHLINTDDFFEEKPYFAGHAFYNIAINFHVVWPENDCCHTTGIITTGKIHNQILKMSSFKTDETLRDELMRAHDEDIIPKSILWKQTMNLGDVFSCIVQSGKLGGFYGMFCRGVSKNYVNNLPKFLTVPLTKEIYYSNFYVKLEELEYCAAVRNFSGYTQIGSSESKLQMRVTVTELCASIREKLKYNCTISNFDFHAIIQIFHGKSFPKECVMYSMNLKLGRLYNELSKMDVNSIFIEKTIIKQSQKEFKLGLELLCSKFQTNLETYINKYPIQLDTIVFVTEKILAGQKISKRFHTEILEMIKIFGIETVRRDKVKQLNCTVIFFDV